MADALQGRVDTLADHWAAVSDDLRNALELAERVPAASVMMSCKVLERVLLEIYERKNGREPEKDKRTVQALLSRHEVSREIPEIQLVRMRWIQSLRNLGGHANHESVPAKEARACVEQSCDIVQWYLETQRPAHQRAAHVGLRRTLRSRALMFTLGLACGILPMSLLVWRGDLPSRPAPKEPPICPVVPPAPPLKPPLAVRPLPPPVRQPARSWTVETIANYDLQDIARGPRGELYAVGAHGTVLRRMGGEWKSEDSGARSDLYCVWVAPTGEVHAVGADGTILYRGVGDSGSWRRDASQPRYGLLYATWGSAADDVYAVGDHGLILHSGDGGAHWAPQKAPTHEPLRRVWGRDRDDVWTVGWSGTVLHRTAGVWRPVRVDNAPYTWDVSGTQRDLWIVANTALKGPRQGLIFRSSDGGASFQPDRERWPGGLFALRGDGKDWYAVGAGGVLLRATADGTWAQEHSAELSAHRTDLKGLVVGGGELWAVGTAGVALHGPLGGTPP